jgi:outer membrane immunogenic protein
MKKLIQLSATPALIAGMTALSPTMAEAQSLLDDVNFYVGATGGYLTGTAKHKDEWPTGSSDETTRGNTGIVSAIVGIDTRTDGWLFGIEGDMGLPLGGFDEDDDASPVMQWSEMEYNAHVRARVGRSIDNVDLFIAGGLAIGKFKLEDWNGDEYGATLTGFTIGGGVDWAFNDLIKARVEVLYDDYGNEDTFDDNNDQYSGDWSDVTVRGGLLFTF